MWLVGIDCRTLYKRGSAGAEIETPRGRGIRDRKGVTPPSRLGGLGEHLKLLGGSGRFLVHFELEKAHQVITNLSRNSMALLLAERRIMVPDMSPVFRWGGTSAPSAPPFVYATAREAVRSITLGKYFTLMCLCHKVI